MTSHLTYSWFLNSTWVRVGDRLLNTDLIQECKYRLATYWRFCLGSPYLRVYVPGPVKQAMSVQRVVDVVTRPIASVMGSDSMVTVQFWSAIWSGLYDFDTEGKLVRRGQGLKSDKCSEQD